MTTELAGRTALSPAATDEFLSDHETGVLSLANADEPYSVPVSYGYDADKRRFFLRLVSAPDSDKDRFLAASPRASLVVYEEDEPVYRSVVAEGALQKIPRAELDEEDVAQYGQAKRPLFEVWGTSLPELDVGLYRLDPETLNGRRIELQRDA